VNPAVMPKRQPPQHSSKEHIEVVEEEMNKLKQAGQSKRHFIPNGWPT